MLTKESKKAIIGAMKKKPGDTGSAVVQVAIITERMNQLTEHFKKYSKDHTSKRGFLKLVGQRRRLMNYLRKNNRTDYKMVSEKYQIK